MRTLTVVSVAHTRKELGDWEKKVVSIRQHIYGILPTEQFFADIEDYWKEVEYRIFETYAQKPDILPRLHIFMDSLPITNGVILEAIIRDELQEKSPMCVIAAALRKKGARIHGTENPQLLIEEHAYWKGRLERDEPEDVPKERRMLQDRDAAIAARINAIVPDEESALLFIGALHRVQDAFHTDPHWTVRDL